MSAQLCEWLAMCANVATTTRQHPLLGAVPICDHCDVEAGPATPLDIWADRINDWAARDGDMAAIVVSADLLHRLTRDLQRAQMVLDAAGAVAK